MLFFFIFLQLLKEDRFSEVDKIRSSGASYMVAVGLAPERPMKVSFVEYYDNGFGLEARNIFG